MKQGIAVMISLSLYLGSLFLIDSALAGGHKGGDLGFHLTKQKTLELWGA